MGLITRALQFRDPIDAKAAIYERVKDHIDNIRVGGEFLLVATYVPSKEARTIIGNMLLPDATIEEYRWQGVTGLVLKLGPLAYKSEKARGYFADRDGEPEPPKVGEWIMYDVKDARPFLMGDQPCRFVACTYVDGILARPDMVA